MREINWSRVYRNVADEGAALRAAGLNWGHPDAREFLDRRHAQARADLAVLESYELDGQLR